MSATRIVRCAGRTVSEANRLTADDRRRTAAAITETITAGNLNAWTRNLDTLVRIAAHAIGCGTVDLRDSELTELHAQAVTLIELHEYAAARKVAGR